jgi:ribosome-associated toxin RatA of RatAB toxin-antitoxin module
MPIQQDIDIGAPLKTVYNQWTQFEEWPEFMHRLENVSQEDETNVSFKTKIWGFSREFKAEIVEQRPDERIKWEVVDGVTHTGVVTFHELGPRLTRVELNIDVQPGSLIEKAARGMRHVKRAVRADLARFKAYVLMSEEETGAWRGRIEDGDVKRKTSRSSGGGSKGRSSGSRSKQASRSQASSQRSSSSARSGSSSSRSRSSSNGRSSSKGGGRSRSSAGRKKSGARS